MAQSMFGSVYDARQEDMDASRKAAYDAAALGGYKTMAAVAGEAGGMLGQGIGRAFGALPQAEAKQVKIQELKQKFPNPVTYEDFMEISNEFMNSNLPDVGEKFFDMAQELKTTASSTNPYLEAQRMREAAAVTFQQNFRNTESLADKQAFNKALVKQGLVATKVYTSMISQINTATAAGVKSEEDTQKWQQKLAKQMTDNNIPSLNVSVNKMESEIAKHNGNLPGINYLEAYDPRSEAKSTYSAFAQLRNIVLKDRSGAAVTNPEFTRLQEEIRGATFVTDKDVIRWTSRLREVLETDKGAIFAGYGSKVKEAYWNTGSGVNMQATSRGKPKLRTFTNKDGVTIHTDGKIWLDDAGNEIDAPAFK